jgi:hypothetical protein
MKASDWIGREGAAFERVCMAFESLGYRPPRGDDNVVGVASTGAYAQNIASQYVADLGRDEALAICEYGFRNSREAITNRYLSEREIVGMYGR